MKQEMQMQGDEYKPQYPWLILVLVIFFLLAAGIITLASNNKLQSRNNGAALAAKARSTPIAAPDFSLKDVAGKDVKLSDYKGKVVVLNFWATWCAPCHLETPWFVELHEQHKSEGLGVIGVSVDPLDDYDPADITAFAKKFSVNYPLVLVTKEMLEAYQPVNALPTTVIVDRTGMIRFRHRGVISKERLETEIKPLL